MQLNLIKIVFLQFAIYFFFPIDGSSYKWFPTTYLLSFTYYFLYLIWSNYKYFSTVYHLLLIPYIWHPIRKFVLSKKVFSKISHTSIDFSLMFLKSLKIQIFMWYSWCPIYLPSLSDIFFIMVDRSLNFLIHYGFSEV